MTQAYLTILSEEIIGHTLSSATSYINQYVRTGKNIKGHVFSRQKKSYKVKPE